MLRTGELVLTLAPLLAAALLWSLVYRRVPSRRSVLLITILEVMVAGVIIWQGTSEGLAPHARYVPAQVHDGVVTDGHGG